MKSINICIAGLGNIGSHLVKSIQEKNQFIYKKSLIKFNIVGISAKNKNKKRIFNVDSHKWFNEPQDLILNSNAEIFIELIGEEKGISYDLVKLSLERKLHVITANKALIAKHGNELFEIAEKNQVLLLFEAAVAGGIPIIKVLKQSLFLNKIYKISGILNGTTNFILSEMEKKNSDFNQVLSDVQKNGFAETDSTNDIEGIDAAHKLCILSVLCFGIKFNFHNIFYKGILDIKNEDINFANKLGYKIKLLASAEIKNNKIISIVEPTLINNNSKLSKVDGVQNGIEIKTDYLNSFFLEGEGAGGKATISSIIADLLEISNGSKFSSLGYETHQLKEIEFMNPADRYCSYYLRIKVKDIPGVLAKITSNLNEENISIKTILQIPDNIILNSEKAVPIIITTHETTLNSLNKAIANIENLDVIISKIVIIRIDKNII